MLHPYSCAKPTPRTRRNGRARQVAGRVAGPLTLVVAVGCLLAGTGGIAEAATTTSFEVGPCTIYDWTVPAGVTAAVFDVYGAAGGDVSADLPHLSDRSGGEGGHVHDALTVSAGEVLTITTADKGGSVSLYGGPGTAPGGTAGCGGGGAGGAGTFATGGATYPGAGGGGASQVSVSGAATPLLVAAGGGGASIYGDGGQGGPQTGGVGSENAPAANEATGGSQSAGGLPGLAGFFNAQTTEGATAGTAGTGGAGGSLAAPFGGLGGGGGGAGWYGGGGGAVDSGAGGSNYIAQGGVDAESDGGVNSGPGHVTVTYGTADFPTFTGSPSDGVTGKAYSYQFQSTSWPAPQYFTTSPNAFPPGVTLSASGTLSGTPTTAGRYTFVVGVAGPVGASSQQITMNVDAAPQVTTQPTDQTATAGQPATFTAAASGSPAPSVQWQVSSDGGSTWSDLTGADSASLTFTATSADNGNSYRAVFANAAGSATTVPAALKVTAAATLSDSPAAGPVGTKVTLSGTGLPPSTAISIRLGSATGKLLATSASSAGGTITVTLNFPAATFSSQVLTAVAGGKVAAKTTFTVEPNLSLPVKAIAPGKTAKATLTGFKAGQKVTLRLASAKGAKLAVLTTSTAGSGSTTITIPATTKAGTYKIYAIGSGQPTATATIKVS